MRVAFRVTKTATKTRPIFEGEWQINDPEWRHMVEGPIESHLANHSENSWRVDLYNADGHEAQDDCTLGMFQATLAS